MGLSFCVQIIAQQRNDPKLPSRYVEIRSRGYESFQENFAMLAQSGLLNATSDEIVSKLADLCWMISEFWLSTVEVSGKTVDEEQMERGIALMIQVLQPYIPKE